MAGGAAGGFVTRAFESMIKECGSKKYPDLQKALQTYIETSQQSSKKAEQGGNITAMLANAGNTLEGAEAELVLNPLRLAFETKSLKICEPALDCLHKLIAYDHLEGDPGIEGVKNVPLFTDILNMVCSCIDNSSPDSAILQLLKVLLTAVASTKFRVHSEPLLGIIRVCSNIALNSKSPINQTTSKAMLTQIISIIFKRMEAIPVSTLSGSTGQIEPASAEISNASEEALMGGSNDQQTTSGEARMQAKDTSLPSLEELHNLASGADIKGLEAVLNKVVHLEDGKKIACGIDLENMSIEQQDALLVFRTLCEMGMKEENDELTTKTRVLSLELLQGVLEGVSDSFTNNFHFIDSVKANLSYTLLRASVSQNNVIFQYATGILKVILSRLRESLRGEIGIFFPLIVLRSLDGSEVNQKLNVLRMLEKVCKKAQLLVDIFVNYDCDLEAPNLFERMVKTLSKIAQGAQNDDLNSVTLSQSNSFRGSSLQCLVNVFNSLVDWEKSCRESKKLRKDDLSNEVSAAESAETEEVDNIKDNFEKAKARKPIMEAVISEFNRKPIKGVEYLISNKLVENTPVSVAQFLKNTPNLDKAMIGDYLGQHEDFPLAVMHAYVDSMNFSGIKFHIAVREFFEGFQLPGEAQKIDRIVEKFAERYFTDNQRILKNADLVYVLVYAVLRLYTDVLNPNAWPKMSKSDFIHMVSMNDSEGSAPTELLEEIYASIIKDGIEMKDGKSDIMKSSLWKPECDGGHLVSILDMAFPKKKSITNDKSESEAIIKKTQAIFKNQCVKRGVFYTSQQVELVGPMVEAVGWPLLATFSVIMEGENKPWVVLCMEGFKAGIHITHVLGMDTMRYAFLTSLVRYTFLHAPKEMRSKNVEAVRTLLDLCDSEPDSLQDTWNAVLECVSQLEFIISTPAVTAIVMPGLNQISRDAELQLLRELAGKPAEQVFLSSTKLPIDSIMEFFSALCVVSSKELKQTPARVFSLQKLVEMSYYNMAQIRMVWARIWPVLANHFVSAGSHHNEKIALHSIDCLRQLVMKYLERAELANFSFQNDILKPIVILMCDTQNETIRRLIVDFIVQMIKSKVVSIKSGWHSVFMIFTSAADDELESIVESAFENVEQVILERFDQIVGDCLMDCVNCLIRFANNKQYHNISLKAIALLRIFEDRLAEGLIPGGKLKGIDPDVDVKYDKTEHYWFPMLAGLSDLTSDLRPEVRSCALEVLFDLLNERGSKFSPSFWESIFHRVLFPIFDHVRNAGEEGFVSSDDEWLRENSIHSLQLLCNLFNTFYKEVCFMLPPLLSLLLDCAKKTDQMVVSISLGALVHLIEVGGHQFSESDWNMLLKSIRDASYSTQPLELLNALGFENLRKHEVVRDSEMIKGESSNFDALGNSQNSVGDNGRVSPPAYSNTTMDGISRDPSASISANHNEELRLQTNVDQSEGDPSLSGSTSKPSETQDLQRNQTIGQRIMGNMMDSLFLKNLTFKSKANFSEASIPSSPVKVHDAVEPDVKDDEESALLVTIRSKCITQLLLLGAIDSIQKKYWSKLKAQQKIAIMEILLSLLEFSASYNSYANLRTRMQQIPDERPPLNLLRQELVGTTIYLDVLRKSTCEYTANQNENEQSDGLITQHSSAEVKVERVAEEKLVSFCEQVLREASDLQSSSGETVNMVIHRILELRSPVIVRVLKGMCSLNNQIFQGHLREFYPPLTKLICCDQMDVRGALGDLFQAQLKPMLS